MDEHSAQPGDHAKHLAEPSARPAEPVDVSPSDGQLSEVGPSVGQPSVVQPFVAGLPLQTVLIMTILSVLGIGMIGQSDRWLRTPSYGNLMQIMPPDAWGGVYLGIGVLLALGFLAGIPRWFRLGAHTLAFVLLAVWEGAFVLRVITDKGTTIANVVSWGTFLILAIWSARLIDARPDTPRPAE